MRDFENSISAYCQNSIATISEPNGNLNIVTRSVHINVFSILPGLGDIYDNYLSMWNRDELCFGN